jgi:hypothetical protein
VCERALTSVTWRAEDGAMPLNCNYTRPCSNDTTQPMYKRKVLLIAVVLLLSSPLSAANNIVTSNLTVNPYISCGYFTLGYQVIACNKHIRTKRCEATKHQIR